MNELSKERERIYEGVGPLNTPEEKRSDALTNEGWEFHKIRKYQEAIRCYTEAIELSPRNALAMNNRGLSKKRLHETLTGGAAVITPEDCEEALKDFDLAIQTAPRFVKPYTNKAETLAQLGRREDSIHWYEEALKVEPGYSYAVHGLKALR